MINVSDFVNKMLSEILEGMHKFENDPKNGNQ